MQCYTFDELAPKSTRDRGCRALWQYIMDIVRTGITAE
jgi:hypothetical protein